MLLRAAWCTGSDHRGICEWVTINLGIHLVPSSAGFHHHGPVEAPPITLGSGLGNQAHHGEFNGLSTKVWLATLRRHPVRIGCLTRIVSRGPGQKALWTVSFIMLWVSVAETWKKSMRNTSPIFGVRPYSEPIANTRPQNTRVAKSRCFTVSPHERTR